MALIKCSECSKEISDMATVCPHCGIENNARVISVKKNKKLSGFDIITIILIGLYSMYTLYDILSNTFSGSRGLAEWLYLLLWALITITACLTIWGIFIYSVTGKKGIKIATIIVLGVSLISYIIAGAYNIIVYETSFWTILINFYSYYFMIAILYFINMKKKLS